MFKSKIRTSSYAKLLGISLSTIYRWLKSGKIDEPPRTHSNHRRFEIEEIKPRSTVIYSRVSSAGQKEDLQRQILFLQNYTKNLNNVVSITDIGSGLNFKKHGFKKLLNMIVNREIDTIVVQNKDRLSRFGVPLIEILANLYGAKLEIVNKTEDTFEANLVADFMALIASFSGSIYGKRSHKNKMVVV